MMKLIYPTSAACVMALSVQNFEIIRDVTDALHREQGHLLHQIGSIEPGNFTAMDRFVNEGGVNLDTFRALQARLPRPEAP